MQENTEEVIESSFAPDPEEKAEVSTDGTELDLTVTVNLSGKRTVTMRYNLSEMTPAQWRKLTVGAKDEDQALDLIAALIESCVTEWDYKTRKGKAVEPIAESVLESVASTDFMAIFQAMFAVQSPNAAEGAG